MKKTLIASAVAATLSSGAFAMDNSHAEKLLGMFDTMPKISGDIEIFGQYTDTGTNTGSTNDGIMDDVDSTVAIDHSTAISEETTAYVHVELNYNATVNGSGFSSDESYLGFKGGFGDISFGTDDSVYESVDIVDYSENLGGVASGDLLGANESQTINYTTPTIGDNMTASASIQTDEDQDNIGAIVIAYAEGDVTFNFGYGMNDVAEDVLGLSGSYTMDDLTLSAQFETQDESGDYMGLLASYAMGANTLNFGFMNFGPETGDDTTGITGSVVHSLADNVYVYVEALLQSSDTDANEMDQFNVGMAYSF